MTEQQLFTPLAVALLPALSHVLGLAAHSHYHALAMQPRRPRLIWQIATFPLVHLNLRHLLFNCVPLLLLGILIASKNLATFWLVTAVVLLVSGWGTWLFSSADQVVGASGLVYGYWGFIIAIAAITQDPWWAIAALLTLTIYSGLWETLGKFGNGVSWACHFWGLLGGLAAALLTGIQQNQ